MNETILIEIKNNKAMGLLYEMEDLNLIKLLEKDAKEDREKLSEKYLGVLDKNQGKSLNRHIEQMRSEWKSI